MSEIFAMFFSQFLMQNLLDITAFRVVYSCGLVSYLTLIFLSHINAMVYFANFLLITSVGGWFNTMLLILEHQVPPQNVGSVSALTRTMAVGACVAAPTIANLPDPWTHVFLLSVSTVGCILTFFLPPPGLHLPSVQKIGDASVLIDRSTNHPTLPYKQDPLNINPPMTNYAMHSLSFNISYTEKSMNMTRPNLIETALDPDVYLNECNYSVSQEDNNSVLHIAWIDKSDPNYGATHD